MDKLFEYKTQLYFDLSYYYDINKHPEVMDGKSFDTLLNGRKVMIQGTGDKIFIYYTETNQLEVFIFPDEGKEIALRHYFFTKLDKGSLEMSYSDAGKNASKYFINANAVVIELNEFYDDPLHEDEEVPEINIQAMLGKDAYEVYNLYAGNPAVRSTSIIGGAGYEDDHELSLQNMLYEERRLDTAFSKMDRKLG